MLSDAQKKELLTVFESITDDEVEKKLTSELFSKEEMDILEKSAFFDLSGGQEDREK